MSISRREFLQGATGAVMASAAPGLVSNATASQANRSAARTLVVLELSGGNDALNTLIPLHDDAYAAARPTLAIAPSQALMLDANVGLHPAMKAMHDLFRQGRLALVQGVGYPNPNRSHFRSAEIWHRADPSAQADTGWLGRYCQHAVSSSTAGIVPMLHFGHEMPELFRSPTHVSIGLQETHSALPLAPRQTKAIYPMGRMGTAFSTFAQLIVQNAGPRLLYLSQSGYDTHARQAETHASLLSGLSSSLGAFLADLTAEGRDRDVLVMIFSEFGRRPKENSSAGTDHGSAGLLMFAGGSVRGGLYGRYPSLSDLHDGDLRYSVDFRDCYATVLEKWLDTPAGAILRTRGRVDCL